MNSDGCDTKEKRIVPQNNDQDQGVGYLSQSLNSFFFFFNNIDRAPVLTVQCAKFFNVCKF